MFSETELDILRHALCATGDIGFNLKQQAHLQRAARQFIDRLDADIQNKVDECDQQTDM